MMTNPTIQRVSIPGGPISQQNATIARIGAAIRKNSTDLDTRNFAAGLATTAKRKDYADQARAVFNGFLRRWRYVHDPLSRELLTESPSASLNWVAGADGKGLGYGLGAGDCDCATIALGSMFEAIGLPVRLATTAIPGSPPSKLMSHIYPEVFTKKTGWIPADPVGYPERRFGQESKYSRKAVFDLNGNLVETKGNFSGFSGVDKMTTIIPETWSRAPMQTFGEMPRQWSEVGLRSFGCSAPKMGVLNGLGQMVEIGNEEKLPYGERARTPIVELRPADFAFLSQNLVPYSGMSGVVDNGQTVIYDGFSGFWRKVTRGMTAAASAGASLAVEKAKAKKKSQRVKSKGESELKKSLQKVFALSEKLKSKLNKKSGGKILKGIGLKSKNTAAMGKNIADNIAAITTDQGNGRVAVNISGDVRIVEMRIVRPILRRAGGSIKETVPVSAFVPGPGSAIAALKSAKKTSAMVPSTVRGLRKSRG